ncbi:poly-A RNA export protein DBP5 [Chondrus crispus]|uniref:RNA helicase n=1 Tax=Chondrus crispus TaxID=2769 RepID=R7QBD0_CHOCR|nr:poly-A RNA export protein DBP5 [Chondrus crispus]CDF35822.1 poly-A RNA export protein DBP5 [Chondrus crispus]|eukprot:XP_005715641.1 poly-A RNA export protein DBP5 [Chondrus crispus]
MTDDKIATNPAPEPVSGVETEGKPEEVVPTPDDNKPTESSDWAGAEETDELGAPPDFAAEIAEADESSRVEVLQADPTTPYHAATTFEEIGMSEELLKGVYHMKFTKPSKIQASSLPLILSADGDHKNLIAQGHNGSGKTACFVLGMLSRVDTSSEATQALCLVPTRELARQIGDVVASLGRYTKATTKIAVKATEEERRAAYAREETGHLTEHIVVGTPGKVMELIKKRRLNTSAMKILVLDEADEMVDTQGMGDQTIRIKRMLPKGVQVLLFSATYADNVRGLASKLAPSANQITIKRETLSLDKIQQYYLDTGSKGARFTILNEIYELLNVGQSIIFVGRRDEAASLSTRLRDDGHAVSVLYGGDMTPEERDRVIDEFRAGTTKVLITTNVLSRGVDVLAVSVVINYDLPTDRQGQSDPETYLHRIGRTGRFGRKGVAVNFVYDSRSKRVLKELEEYYSKPITRVEDAEELQDRLKDL